MMHTSPSNSFVNVVIGPVFAPQFLPSAASVLTVFTYVMDGVTHGASAWKSNSRDRRYYRQGGSDEFAAIERVAADRGLPPSTVARERLLAMTREDQGAAADVVAVLFDVVDQLRAVATRMNPNAVGA